MVGWVFSSRVYVLKRVTVDFWVETCRALADAHCSTSAARAAKVAVASEVASAVAETVKSSA